MILILGSNRDDVLYFQSVIRNRRTRNILGKYTATIGEIFNQKVMIIDNVFTSYVSSVLVSHVLETELISLVVMVGKCYSIDGGLVSGDIALSKNIVCMDVDQIEVENVKLGQIPGPITMLGGSSVPAFNQTLTPSIDILSTLHTCLEKFSVGSIKECTFMSNNTVFTSKNQLDYYSDGSSVLGFDKNIIFDSESGGAAVACTLYDVPFVAIKVVEKSVGESTNISQYMNVLSKYAIVGKAVISLIGEVGRSDVLGMPGGRV